MASAIDTKALSTRLAAVASNFATFAFGTGVWGCDSFRYPFVDGFGALVAERLAMVVRRPWTTRNEQLSGCPTEKKEGVSYMCGTSPLFQLKEA